MACRLVALDQRPGVRPVGIVKTLRWDLAKLVMTEAGDQAKTVCGNLQLCAGFEAGIEGATHAVGLQSIDRLRARCRVAEEAEASDDEEGSGDVAEVMGNLIIETAGTEDEGEEQLEDGIEMEVAPNAYSN